MGIPFLAGAAVGLNEKVLPGLKFDVTGEYTVCLICGEVFQSDLDREVVKVKENYPHVSADDQAILDEVLPDKQAQATVKRRLWAYNHRRKHPEKEHAALKASGQLCTPEALLKLSPLGIIPLSPNDEMKHAMLEAPRAPKDDVEGT